MEPLGSSARSPDAARRWWWAAVVVLTLVALGVRFAAVATYRYKGLGQGDAEYYHLTANLMARGIFGINPFDYQLAGHPRVASADFPPLFPAVLALASLVGAKSVLAHRIWCCFIGAAAVPLGMLFGRQVVGRRVGIIAGLLIAVYPNLWMSDTLVLSETLTPVVILLVLMAAYRFWRRPEVKSAVWLGAALAAAALARDELALLVVLILVPLAFLVPARAAESGTTASLRSRLRLLVAALAAAGLIVGPWVGWNLSRFDKPVFISSGFGITLATGNCKLTWYGQYVGYWTVGCGALGEPNPAEDESQQSAAEESHALRFIDSHLDQIPRVAALKIGRGFGLYKPFQQIGFDSFVETRPDLWAHVGLYMYYGLAVLSIGGAVVLRRRRILLFPLLMVGVDVVTSMLISFGNTRYRTPFEVSLVVLASVQLDMAVGWVLRRRAGPAEAAASGDVVAESPPALTDSRSR